MNEQLIGTMFALIREVVCGAEIGDAHKAAITAEMLPQLYAISKSHDMAHIVAQGLSDLELLGEDEISQKFRKHQMLAIYRYQKINYELQQICSTLENARIPFLPLKGSVIRKYYPEPWMRTSCDVDVLVKDADLEQATSVLEKDLAYQNKGRTTHNISFFSESGIHVELHYDTVEEGRAVRANAVLSQIWESALPKEPDGLHMVLTDEMFYFYHVAHMAKHLEEGGCGIRPFLDLWLLERRAAHDQTVCDRLLEQGGLLTFANACRQLSKVWFDSEAPNETTEQMQAYILYGGVYGNLENRVAVHQNKQGGRFQYLLSRVFPPYDYLKHLYPVLQKHRWLTPIMEVRRLLRILFKGHVKKSLHELNVNKTMSQEKISETAELLNKLGLQ